jgi:hypothetical protein
MVLPPSIKTKTKKKSINLCDNEEDFGMDAEVHFFEM